MAMPTRVRSQPNLADILALARALDRDAHRTAAELRARDGRLAREITVRADDRVGVALGWLEAVEREDGVVRTIHDRAETAIRLTGFGVALAGIVIGWGATAAAFYFDGTGRVNAVAVLAFLVGIPLVLLIPFGIAALSPAVAGRLPGAAAIGAAARGLSPGRVAQWLWRALARESIEGTEFVAARVADHQRLYSGVQRWALLRWSQWFALWFQISALVASLVLVVFTDLAFGWSTTLTTGDAALDAQRVHRVTAALAAPWARLAPDAAPSLELIQESRYFRVAAGPVSPTQAARLGGWWKFVVFTIAVYGVLPRAITLAIARARLRAAARGAIVAAPGFSAVLRRLHAARIETAAVKPESDAPETASLARVDQPSARTSGGLRAVINWAAVPLDANTLTATFGAAPVFAAGGSASIEDDAAVIKKLGATSAAGGGDVLILVKGWEPPLMEFIDFVKALRAALGGEAAEFVVLPVGLAHRGAGLIPATTAQFKLWRDKLERIGDRSLRVAAHCEEVVP
jgi:hypothetical protein